MMKATFTKGDSTLTCEASEVNVNHLAKDGWVRVAAPAPAPVVEEAPEDATIDAQPARRVGRPRKYE
jgi:hypothetical protein